MVAERGQAPPMAKEAKALTHQIAGDNVAIEDDQRRPSNTDVRVATERGSGSELDESQMKGLKFDRRSIQSP